MASADHRKRALTSALPHSPSVLAANSPNAVQTSASKIRRTISSVRSRRPCARKHAIGIFFKLFSAQAQSADVPIFSNSCAHFAQRTHGQHLPHSGRSPEIPSRITLQYFVTTTIRGAPTAVIFWSSFRSNTGTRVLARVQRVCRSLSARSGRRPSLSSLAPVTNRGHWVAHGTTAYRPSWAAIKVSASTPFNDVHHGVRNSWCRCVER